MQNTDRHTKRNEFILGQIAQEAGDYYALIRRYDEAAEEYQHAVMSYRSVQHTSPDYAEARKKSEAVERILKDLQTARKPMKMPIPDILTPVTDGIRYAVRWMSDLWTPQMTGQLATAADTPKQDHCFPTDQGEIRISCSWERSIGSEPAYIWLKWDAAVETDAALHVRFIDPDTQEILHDVRLGNIRSGEEAFTAGELGFDPSARKWAVVVMLAEPDAAC